ncbi:MAG TPA: cyclic nucleotide-binding domain-containing protein [Desulfobacteraceae bacterium]|nr:cyclic nucleotide-binding domain-containing protein [Desulfobacteraceae bacterium]
MKDPKDIIKDIVIFSRLSDNDIKIISNILREVRFKEGETIIEEDEEGNTMYIILEGEVEISKTLSLGNQDKMDKILTRLTPESHEVIGEMALIAREKRSASVTALSDCVLYEIKRDDLNRIIEENPCLGIKILYGLCELLSKRLKKAGDDIIKLSTALAIALSG